MAQLVQVELVEGAGRHEVVVRVPHVRLLITCPGPQEVLGLATFLIIRTDRQAESEMFGNKGSGAVELGSHQLYHLQILLVVVVGSFIARALRCVEVNRFGDSHVVFLISCTNILTFFIYLQQ